MQLVKSTIPKEINTLYIKYVALIGFFFGIYSTAFSQDNSPYSRYGIGDLVPPTHIINRGMGGISAGYRDLLSINFNNPASYSAFQTFRELKSKKIVSGRAILDIGMNFENRTLREPAPAAKFAASNALFSYVQIGVPLKSNWGLSFGLRPVSRISYKITQSERLKDPNTQQPIDSAVTQYEGDGGAYLASVGTGFKIKNLSLGINAGYLFGKKDYKTKRSLINDTVNYLQANYETNTSFEGLHFTIGAQYKLQLNKDVSVTLGAYGDWGQQVNASKDIVRETFYYDAALGDTRLDSVSDQRNVKGKILFPTSYTVGFVTEKAPQGKEGGWMFGIDFTQQNWSSYRFYGQADLVQNSWQLKVGGQLHPAPKRNYFSNVAYRAGFFIGPDYIRVKEKLPQLGITFGVGLPIVNYNRLSPGQFSVINLAFEYSKKGNNDNLLKENMFRVSVGFSLSDLWFGKHKYE
jgi:hypothetical protein